MNAAERILIIYDKFFAVAQPNGNADQKLLLVWGKVFEIEETLEDEIVQCQSELRSQLNAVSMAVIARGLPSDMLEPGFSRLRNAAAPSLNYRQWRDIQGNLVLPECRLNFRIAVWELRDQIEDEIDDATLSELSKELADLELASQSPSLTPYLRSFIKRQIEAIRAALRLYRVAGAKPMQDALRQVVGDLTVERPALDAEIAVATPESKNALAKVGALFGKVAKAVDSLDNAKKTAETAYGLYNSVAPMIEGMVTKILT